MYYLVVSIYHVARCYQFDFWILSVCSELESFTKRYIIFQEALTTNNALLHAQLQVQCWACIYTSLIFRQLLILNNFLKCYHSAGHNVQVLFWLVESQLTAYCCIRLNGNNGIFFHLTIRTQKHLWTQIPMYFIYADDSKRFEKYKNGRVLKSRKTIIYTLNNRGFYCT